VARSIPTHWSRHTDPNNWFGMGFPSTWRFDMTDGTAGLSAPDQGGVLTVRSFWLDENRRTPVDALVNLDQLFPKRRNVRALNPVGGGEEFVGYEGEGLVTVDAPWWRRPFQKQQWRRWRIWCLRRGSVYVMALYFQKGNPDYEAETVASMIVDSIEFHDQPACPPEVFAARVLELARRKFPLLDCQPVPDFQIKLGESNVNLFNFYCSYLKAPEHFESIVLPALATVVQVQGWGKDQTEPAIEAVRGRIMPMLYPEDVWHERFPKFVGTPWVAGLVVVYVVDESNSYWFIRNDLLESWKLSTEDLHQIALHNLDRYFDDQPMEFTVAGEDEGPRLLIPRRPDAYNTSRLLSEQFHHRLREILGSEFAVGAPSRDFFVAVSLNSSEAVEHVRKRVEDDFQQMDHPLTDQLLLVARDGVTEFAPWV
jgi:Protein of unknown function (DUF1444)